MSDLEIGADAPGFTLPANGGGEVTLSELKGKKVVLFLYPRADTPGCTKEAVGFTEAKAEFEAAGATVLGLSNDKVAKLDKFTDKHSLGVPLLSDEDSKVIDAYGSWVEKNMYGKKSMGVERSTFLIDEAGKIAQIWRKVKVPGHVDAVLEAVKGA
ncbi:MAG: thioredoxin-dependent thiol peroxidase [Pseudomonadota bacterium]